MCNPGSCLCNCEAGSSLYDGARDGVIGAFRAEETMSCMGFSATGTLVLTFS